jgi:pseudaminic acid biosynthesis-associated methylase
MSELTSQMAKWSGEFGRDYTDRNTLSLAEIEALYVSLYGVNRTSMNARLSAISIVPYGFSKSDQMSAINCSACKVWDSLAVRHRAARLRVEISKRRMPHLNIIEGSAFDIPFKDGFFDLVFTSGVLIHIAPSDITKALQEIHRCSRRLIWGFEYFSESYTEVVYRGNAGLLWKTNFSQLYLDTFGDLRLVKEERFKYKDDENVDKMFLLEKVK